MAEIRWHKAGPLYWDDPIQQKIMNWNSRFLWYITWIGRITLHWPCEDHGRKKGIWKPFWDMKTGNIVQHHVANLWSWRAKNDEETG